MRIVITGADGFIGRNLTFRLRERAYGDLIEITPASTADELRDALRSAQFVFHLAGVNRPRDVDEFARGNTGYTEHLCAMLDDVGSKAPVVFSSSTQATLDNPYGRSKRAAEDILLAHGGRSGVPVHVFRLTNVFGKWARPNYNSAVATFCHNIARGIDITINDPAAALRLVYIDDVIDAFVALLEAPEAPGGYHTAGPEHETTVGEVAQILRGFADSRVSLRSPRCGTGFVRALYSTYLSFLPPTSFAYDVPRHEDTRGTFVEVLRTPDCGQFSYFTAHPGITRGEHYHHSKTEKFLVIKGTARFGFRHLVTGERHELVTRGGEARIVETAPGWAHNIANIGDDEIIVMLWANEVFDQDKPDTYAMKVDR